MSTVCPVCFADPVDLYGRCHSFSEVRPEPSEPPCADAKERSPWMPIETAPKVDYPHKNHMVLLLEGDPDDYHYSVHVGFWGDVDGHFNADEGDVPHLGWMDWGKGLTEDDFWTEVLSPTHWMPLPAPPMAHSESQDGRINTPGMSKTYVSTLPQGPPDPTILAIVRAGERPSNDTEGDD
jgi:Protein of unknown function (DUF551)